MDMKPLAKFLALGPREQAILLEAVIHLTLARLLLLVPFRWVAPRLGQMERSGGKWASPLNENQQAAAIAVRQALSRVASRLPWESSCLVRAIAGQAMLRRRRLPSELHLGARNSSSTEIAAHAWLRCGEIDVTGGEIAGQYTPIAAFRI